MKSKEEIAEELYDINRMISLYWIGMKQKPTEEQIMQLNQRLGEIIKELRENEKAIPLETLKSAIVGLREELSIKKMPKMIGCCVGCANKNRVKVNEMIDKWLGNVMGEIDGAL